MIIFIFGKDNYLVLKRYQKHKNAFEQKYPNAHLDLIDFDQGSEIQKLIESLKSGSGLFSQKRCIVIKNPFSVSILNQKQIVNLLEDKKDDENLIILVVEMCASKPAGILLKFFKENVKFEYQELLKQNEIQRWIEKEVEFRRNGKLSIEKDAIQMLGQISQGNMWFLDRELEKLVNYVPEGKIMIGDVEKLCKGVIEVGVFEFVDALGAKDLERAIKSKNSLITQGKNEFYILSMITSQLRNLLKVEECLRCGIFDPQTIAGKCGMHPFVVRKSLDQLRNFSRKQLKDLFDLVAEIDRKTKKGEINIVEALDYFIAKI